MKYSLEQLIGQEKPIYYVIVDGAYAPTREHRSRIAASKEAKRLSRLNPDKHVHVVKLKERFCTKTYKPHTDDHRPRFYHNQLVRVVDTHHARAGEVGKITDFPNAVNAVVHFDDGIYTLRLTSLLKASKKDKKQWEKDQQEKIANKEAAKSDQETHHKGTKQIFTLLSELFGKQMTNNEEQVESSDSIKGALHDAALAFNELFSKNTASPAQIDDDDPFDVNQYLKISSLPENTKVRVTLLEATPFSKSMEVIGYFEKIADHDDMMAMVRNKPDKNDENAAVRKVHISRIKPVES